MIAAATAHHGCSMRPAACSSCSREPGRRGYHGELARLPGRAQKAAPFAGDGEGGAVTCQPLARADCAMRSERVPRRLV